MLDVHPPHTPTHTWRDFLLHIATIVVGLLIAIGLEQTVEFLHHRRQASEALELLKVEREKNRASLEIDFYTTIHHQHDLLNDLAVLRRLRSHSSLPTDKLLFSRPSYGFFDFEWNAIRQSGVISFINSADLKAVPYTYDREDDFVTRGAKSAVDLAYATAMLNQESPWMRESSQSSAHGELYLDTHHADGRGVLDVAALEREYSHSYIDQSRFSKLLPAQIDRLENAITIALVDDGILLNDCYSIERWIKPTGTEVPSAK
jgi:hypothetical protein